jgi:hypothetical protein
MAKKKAVGKAKKSPTVKQLRKEIAVDTGRENTLKHDAATAHSAVTRKHDLARASAIGKTVASLKHELADKSKHKKAGLALAPGDVACCAAQAAAASLWLALGVRVHDEDVLGLYWRTAADPDEGASVLATLEAAHEYGLSGARPVGFGLAGQWGQRAVEVGDQSASGAERLEISAALDWDLADVPHLAALAPAEHRQPDVEFGDLLGVHGLILRLDLPEGPHAVTAAPDGTWWSWGEPYSPEGFPGAVVEECWAVSWS